MAVGFATSIESYCQLMNKEDVIAQFPSLFPLAVKWATEQERLILEHGVALTPEELEDALAVGIQKTSQMRLLAVSVIPRPDHPQLREACDAIDFLTMATRGLTLGYGIFIRQDCWRDRALVAHELVHVAQYERFGGIDPFLRTYLTECLTAGYANSPLEREASGVVGALFGNDARDQTPQGLET